MLPEKKYTVISKETEFVEYKWKPEEKDPIDKGIDEAISSILSFVQKQ